MPGEEKMEWGRILHWLEAGDIRCGSLCNHERSPLSKRTEADWKNFVILKRPCKISSDDPGPGPRRDMASETIGQANELYKQGNTMGPGP
jgi:hypothetical protein